MVCIFTVRGQSCGKVMFLHLSVSHSVHGGCLPQCMLGYTPGRHPPGQTPPGRTPPWKTPPTPKADNFPPSQQMATAADGAHPTGMLSCGVEVFTLDQDRDRFHYQYHSILYPFYRPRPYFKSQGKFHPKLTYKLHTSTGTNVLSRCSSMSNSYLPGSPLHSPMLISNKSPCNNDGISTFDFSMILATLLWHSVQASPIDLSPVYSNRKRTFSRALLHHIYMCKSNANGLIRQNSCGTGTWTDTMPKYWTHLSSHISCSVKV